MNNNVFKSEICSYCKYNQLCSKDKIEYIEINKIVYLNDFYKNNSKTKILNEYHLENTVKQLSCKKYKMENPNGKK